MGFLLNLWNWISYLGISPSKEYGSALKQLVLTNRINFILLVLGSLAFMMLLFFSPVKVSQFNINEYRILLTAALGGLNLILANAGANRISRISLIFMPVFILSVMPIFMGVVNDESYLDYPWFIITASMTPHFVLSQKENRYFYYFSLLYFLVLLLPLEQILIFYNNPEVHILPIVTKNYLYMKLTQVSIYGFLNLSILYLQSLSKQHEANLEKANAQLQDQSFIINQQADELKERNILLVKHQEELNLYNRDLQNQNRELAETLHKLKETQAQLIQAEKLATIGMLTAGIAHEINNPINYIYSSLEGLRVSFEDCNHYVAESLVLLDSEIPEKLAEIKKLGEKYDLRGISTSIPILLDNIQKGSVRATEIVRSLLFFTYNNEDKPRPVNLFESIEASVVMLNHLMKNRIELVRNYNELPQVYCYPGKINQVFMNLLSNAVQSIDEAGTITITTENIPERNSVQISFRDTGKGISPKIYDKIFDPFFSTKEAGKGTGLGLPIVLTIVNEHDGKLSFESVEGMGTEFRVELPVSSFNEESDR
jgi:signal transduction histidine kinase